MKVAVEISHDDRRSEDGAGDSGDPSDPTRSATDSALIPNLTGASPDALGPKYSIRFDTTASARAEILLLCFDSLGRLAGRA